MFLRSLVKLNNSISVRNVAPRFRCRQKKSLRRILVLSPSGFLVAKWVLLARKPRAPDISPPAVFDLRGCGPPKIDTYARTFRILRPGLKIRSGSILYAIFGATKFCLRACHINENKPIVFRYDHFSANAAFRFALHNRA